MSNMTATENTQDQAWIRREWKRADKRAYAQALVSYLRDGGREPERPASLSLMGAQAIRMRISARRSAA